MKKIALLLIGVIVVLAGVYVWTTQEPEGTSKPTETQRPKNAPTLIKTGYVAINKIVPHPNGTSLFLDATDPETGRTQLALIDRYTGKTTHALTEVEKSLAFHDMHFYKGGERLLAIQDNTATIWDTASGDTVNILKAGPSRLFYISDQKGYPALGTSHQNKFFVIVDGETSDIKTGVPASEPFTRILAYTPSQQYVFALFEEEKEDTEVPQPQLGIWNLADGKRIMQFDEPGVTQLVIHPNQDRFLTLDRQLTEVHLWLTGTKNKRIFKRPGHPIFFYVSFSPDGQTILAGGRGSFVVWDMESGEEIIHQPSSNPASVYACYTPDGQQMITGYQDGSIRWTDVAELKAAQDPAQ